MLYFPVVLALFIWLWPRIWFRVVKDKIQLQVTLSQPSVEIGESLSIAVQVVNKSWLPCPQVMFSIELPRGLSADAERQVYAISRSTFLLMRQEVTFTVACYGQQRGLQDLRHRDVILRMNEGFGLRELFLRREIAGSIIVFPRRVSAQSDLQAMRDINGELERARWLLPDEALLRGIRAYSTGDPFKHIAWHATAKTGSWMTKQFSSSTDVSVGVVLNAQFINPHWLGTKVAMFDELCAFANALTALLHRDRVPTFYASNAIYPGSTKRQWYGRQSYSSIKHMLGSVLPYTNGDFHELLTHTLHQLPSDSPLVVFTGFLTEEQASILRHTARDRYVYVVAPATSHLPALPDARVIYFTSQVEDELQTAAGDILTPPDGNNLGVGIGGM